MSERIGDPFSTLEEIRKDCIMPHASCQAFSSGFRKGVRECFLAGPTPAACRQSSTSSAITVREWFAADIGPLSRIRARTPWNRAEDETVQPRRFYVPLKTDPGEDAA